MVIIYTVIGLIAVNFLLLAFSINKVSDRSKTAHYEKPLTKKEEKQ